MASSRAPIRESQKRFLYKKFDFFTNTNLYFTIGKFLNKVYQRPWLIQDDTGLIQNCINRLKNYLCDTNFYNRLKNDTTLYQRDKKVYQRVLDDTKVYQHPLKFITKCSLSRLFMFLHRISSRIPQLF